MSDCITCPRRLGRTCPDPTRDSQLLARIGPEPHRLASPRAVPLSGIINLDKPAGMTSHDVVDAVRRLSGQRKVGHAGTLDPMATGVLLICLGTATRVAEFLTAGRKRYRANIVLGTATDTYDAEGQIVASGGRTDFTVEEIETVLASFVGHIEQLPPMFSAVKQGGQPLYRRARRGETVERQARVVDITEIVLLDWTPPALVVEVACSPGTYIRALAHDLGQRLSCGAHLSALVRLSSGRFTLEDAVSLDRLSAAFRQGEQDRYLLPMDEALLHLPAMLVSADDACRILHGQEVAGEPATSTAEDSSLCRAYSIDGDFLAILSYNADTGCWRPFKVFASIQADCRSPHSGAMTDDGAPPVGQQP